MASVELSSRDPHVPADQQSLLDTRHEVSNGAPQDQLDARAILDVQSGVRTKSQIRQICSGSRVVFAATSAALLLAILACWGLYLLHSSQGPTAKVECPSLSDQSINPGQYNLTFEFSEANFIANDTLADHAFTVDWAMEFDVTDSLASFFLHGADFNFTAVELYPTNAPSVCLCGRGCLETPCSKIVVPKRRVGCSDSHTLQIDLSGTILRAGDQATLRMQYRGRFSAENAGLYRSHNFTLEESVDGTKQQRVLLATQLETNSARLVFPCLDEPAQKAVFVVGIIHPAYLTALTNTEAWLSRLLADGRMQQYYEPSPIMSPYLLALCVGSLISLTSKTDLGVTINAWATPSLGAQLSLPLAVRFQHGLAVKALEFYGNWTGIKQPLQKFDLVAVPGKEGAMENWGLLLFDERRFLWNNETEGAHGQWLSADVICHEVAHQWFGNLVTCRDWDHLTLNEGMASFMEYLCIDSILAGSKARALALRAPSLIGEGPGIHEGPHKIALQADDQPFTSALIRNRSASPILKPSGALLYSKGAALLSMLQSFLDGVQPGSFKESIRAFVKKFAFKTATVDDLVSQLFIHQDPSLARQFLEWWYSAGFPVLSVKILNDQIALEQSQFLEWNADNSSQAPLWAVPILNTEGRLENLTWSLLTDAQLKIKGNFSEGWWLANPDGSGLYRAHYSSELLSSFLIHLDSPESHYAQATLICDLFALLLQGVGSSEQTLTMTSALVGNANTTDSLALHLVWGTALDCMEDLRLAIRVNDTCARGFDAYTLRLTQAAIHEVLLSFDNSSPADAPLLDRLNYGTLFRAAALAGNNELATFLCEKAFVERLTPGYIDLMPTASIIAVVNASACSFSEGTSRRDAWEAMLLHWLEGEDATLAEQGLLAAAYTQQAASVQEMMACDALQSLLELVLLGRRPVFQYRNDNEALRRLVPSRARQSDVLKILMRDKAGAESVWGFISSNWMEIAARQGVWDLLESLPLLPSRKTLEDVQEAAERHAGSFSAARSRTLGALHHRIQWAEAFSNEVCSYIDAETPR